MFQPVRLGPLDLPNRLVTVPATSKHAHEEPAEEIVVPAMRAAAGQTAWSNGDIRAPSPTRGADR